MKGKTTVERETKYGRIPLAPVRAAVLRWWIKQEYEPTGFHYHGHQEVILPVSPAVRLAQDTGIGIDTIYSIKGREGREWVGFDIADKIISAIDPHLWRTDPELSVIYNSFDLSYLDQRHPVAA